VSERLEPPPQVSHGLLEGEVPRRFLAGQTTRYQVTRACRSAARDGHARRRGAPLPRWLSLDEAHHRRGRELSSGLDNQIAAPYLHSSPP